MPRFAKSTLFSVAFFLLAVVALPAQATPGVACQNIDGCSDGESCFQNVCRTSCTTDASRCNNGTQCQLLFSGASARACLPSESEHDACEPDCANGFECRFISSLGESRCINPQTGAAQTIPANPTVNDNQGNAGGQTLTNPLKAKNLEELLLAILRGVIQLGTIFLVLALVWTGFLFVYAQGAEERIKNARAALMWTVVGGLLLLGAQGIALVLQATVNAL